jgi:hypothetical protein
MEVLDLLLDSARRHVRHDEEDVREWARATPPADDGALLRGRITAVADRMRATFGDLQEAERLYQRSAYGGSPDPTTERHIRDVARRQAANAGALLRLIGGLPEQARPGPGVLRDLELLEFEANELPHLMDSENEARLGKVASWEEVRKQLGL